jgi:hypothetical protein
LEGHAERSLALAARLELARERANAERLPDGHTRRSPERLTAAVAIK